LRAKSARKCVCGWGRDPAGGAKSAPPDFVAGFVERNGRDMRVQIGGKVASWR